VTAHAHPASGSGTEPTTAFLVEAAPRLGVSRRRLEIAVHAARAMTRPEFEVVEKLLTLTLTKVPKKSRSSFFRGLNQTLDSLQQTREHDPLAQVDGPLEPLDAFQALYGAAEDSQEIRGQLLRDSISAAEAAELTGRSRQALERQRRQGRLLALRLSNQWRYPRWQFDVDAPGGIVPGLAEVLPLLGLSPTGAAFWLSRSCPELDGKAPVALLHQRRADPVLRLAKEQGLMP
jgi:Helix-turn-helix domain